MPCMRSHAGISRNREFPTHPCTKLWQPFWPCPPLNSVLRRWGGSSFKNFRKNPVLRVPPRYWRCCTLSVSATLRTCATGTLVPLLIPVDPTGIIRESFQYLFSQLPDSARDTWGLWLGFGCVVALVVRGSLADCRRDAALDGRVSRDSCCGGDGSMMLNLCLSAGGILRRAGAAMPNSLS